MYKPTPRLLIYKGIVYSSCSGDMNNLEGHAEIKLGRYKELRKQTGFVNNGCNTYRYTLWTRLANVRVYRVWLLLLLLLHDSHG